MVTVAVLLSNENFDGGSRKIRALSSIPCRELVVPRFEITRFMKKKKEILRQNCEAVYGSDFCRKIVFVIVVIAELR